jgi:hypothetical protein
MSSTAVYMFSFLGFLGARSGNGPLAAGFLLLGDYDGIKFCQYFLRPWK